MLNLYGNFCHYLNFEMNFVAAVLLLALLQSAKSQISFSEKEYYIEYEKLAGNYNVAEQVCEIRGMAIASITEQETFVRIVKDVKQSSESQERRSSFYVGLQRVTANKVGFRWNDGSALESNYAPSMWAPGHPGYDDCAALTNQQFLLVTTNCSGPGYFICERTISSSLLINLLAVLVGMSLLAGACIMIFARMAGREPELAGYNLPRFRVPFKTMNLAHTLRAISRSSDSKLKIKGHMTKIMPKRILPKATSPSKSGLRNKWRSLIKFQLSDITENEAEANVVIESKNPKEIESKKAGSNEDIKSASMAHFLNTTAQLFNLSDQKSNVTAQRQPANTVLKQMIRSNKTDVKQEGSDEDPITAKHSV